VAVPLDHDPRLGRILPYVVQVVLEPGRATRAWRPRGRARGAS
jgi:hypothetical protein